MADRCVICAKREPDIPPVCGPCRWVVDLRLREIPELAAELYSLGSTQRDARPKWVDELDEDGDPTGVRILTNQPVDPAAHWFTSGPIPGASRAPRVAGSRERGVPVRLDLLGRPDTRSVSDPNHDQAGSVAIAAVLDSWCQNWVIHDWCRGDYLPEPTIRALVGWLRVRLEDALDNHAAIDDFADEIREIHLALRRACGLTDPQPELLDGISCRRCDLKTLYRMPGSIWVECISCGLLLDEAEYKQWLGMLAAAEKRDQPFNTNPPA